MVDIHTRGRALPVIETHETRINPDRRLGFGCPADSNGLVHVDTGLENNLTGPVTGFVFDISGKAVPDRPSGMIEVMILPACRPTII